MIDVVGFCLTVIDKVSPCSQSASVRLPEVCYHLLLVTSPFHFAPVTLSLHAISSAGLCPLRPSKGCLGVAMSVSRVPGVGVCPVLEAGELKMDGEDSICALETHRGRVKRVNR